LIAEGGFFLQHVSFKRQVRIRKHLLGIFCPFGVLDIDAEHFEGLEKTAEFIVSWNCERAEDFGV